MPHIVRNPSLDAELADALVGIWVDVTNAGGAVGFVSPTSPAAVWPTAESAFARIRDGRDDLVVAYDREPRGGGEPVGFAFLGTNEWALARHWGRVQRLQRHPSARAQGVGGALLAEVEAAARDRALDRLVLTVRGGTGREGFYLDRGFRLEARLPGRIRTPDGDAEELHMSKALDATTEAAVAPVTLQIVRLDPDLPVPAYAHPGDAGLDLYAREGVRLGPGQRAVVGTGIAVAIPPGFVGLVHPRSGLAARGGLGILNAPGTIDAGYRGEVAVILVNHDPEESVEVARGERVAQLLLQEVANVVLDEVDALPPSERGVGGFGSTSA